MKVAASSETINLKLENINIQGNLFLPVQPSGIVVFAHGSGSSRFSPRNNLVAKVLHKESIASFLVDLLTEEEDQDYQMRFDIELLTKRLLAAVEFIQKNQDTQTLPLGLFGASTGGAAALEAAVSLGPLIKAIVLRGARPDLAGSDVYLVQSPTLFIVGEFDTEVLDLNRAVHDRLELDDKKLEIIPGATHLFEEPGAIEQVAKLSADWFKRYLK